MIFHAITELTEISEIFTKNANIKDFSINTIAEAIEYIKNELPSIHYSAVTKLANAFLQNIPLLQSEIAKLSLIPELTTAEAIINCNIRSEKELFKALDALLSGNPSEAVALLQIAESTNDFEILCEVTRALRKPAIYTKLLLSGWSIQKSQAATGIKDYPAKKYAAGSDNSKRELITLYCELCNLDVSSKTG